MSILLHKSIFSHFVDIPSKINTRLIEKREKLSQLIYTYI